MITTIVAFGPYYTARHISAQKGGESDISIPDYRYFGDMAFCHNWQQNMKKVGLEVTDDQIQCLYMGIDPRDTSIESMINISAYLPVGMAVASWESNAGVKPVAGGGIPTTINQLNNDPNVSGLDVSGTPMAGQTMTSSPGGGIVAPNLVYPNVPPPFASTHLHGCYQLTQFGNLKWMEYDQPLLQSQLPVNLKWSDDHWIDQLQPVGTIYIGRNPEGLRVYLRPGNPSHLE